MYGFLRVEKYKKTDLYGVAREANRTKEEHEHGLELPRTRCDWERTPENYFYKRTESAVHDIQDRIKAEGITKKPRKDAVLAVGIVAGASPEFFQDKSREETLAYFDKVMAQVISIYCQGDPSRLVSAVVHMDEQTPHLHALITPLYTQEKDGKKTTSLSAKQLIGDRTKMHRTQNELYKNVFSLYGFERGQITTEQAVEDRRKHQDTAAYYEAQRQTTLEDLTKAQAELVQVNRHAIEDNTKAVEKATEALEQAKKAMDKTRHAITKTGQEYKARDAIDLLEQSAKDLQRANMNQIGATQKAETLTQDIERAIDQRTETKLANARAKLKQEKDKLKAQEKALQAREKALKEKEKNIEQEIEKRAQERAQSLSQRFIDRVRRFLGEHGWSQFMSFQANERAQEMDIQAKKLEPLPQDKEQEQDGRELG